MFPAFSQCFRNSFLRLAFRLVKTRLPVLAARLASDFRSGCTVLGFCFAFPCLLVAVSQ